MAVFIISVVLAVLYITMTLLFLKGWLSLKVNPLKANENTTSVTVIVAARNEQDNILNCLGDLCKQSYPKRLYEIIIADDNSDDNTVALCLNYIEKYKCENVQIIKLSDYKISSKKEAISLSVGKAMGKLILTTDADCRLNTQWIQSFADFYESNSFKLIAGPVCYFKKNGLFQKFQLLDFLSMIVSGAGAIAVNKSFIANAANMAFERKVFLELNNVKYDNNLASGDDVFLLHKVKKKYPHAIGFNKSADALVTTQPQPTFNEMVRQRVRWASKSKSYKDFHAIYFASLVFAFNFWLVFTTSAGFFNTHNLFIAAALWLVKLTVDFPLLYSITNFVKQKDLLTHYIWIQFCYPFYIVFTAIVSIFIKKYKWKGRLYQ